MTIASNIDPQRSALQPAYVLHARPYRETSLIVDFLLPDRGRINVVARGVNRSRSNLKALLQPFNPLLVGYYGKSELKTLKTAERSGAPIRLQGEALFSALYLNELLARVMRAQDHCQIIFSEYEQALRRLADGSGIEASLRHFELLLLEQLGYAIPFPDAESDPATLYYYTEAGYFDPLQQPLAGSSTRCFRGSDLVAIAAGDLVEGQSLRAAKQLMRLALAPLLGDKPLYSRELFTQQRKTKHE